MVPIVLRTCRHTDVARNSLLIIAIHIQDDANVMLSLHQAYIRFLKLLEFTLTSTACTK